MTAKMQHLSKAVCNNVRRLRKEMGWTQQELLEEMQKNLGYRMTREALHLIEHHKNRPSLEVAQAITASLGRPVQEVWYLDYDSLNCSQSR